MEEAKTMKLALLQSKSGTIFAGIGDSCGDYIRISEHVEVTFPPLPKDEITRGRIAIIDEELAGLFEQIERLRQRKQELLALEFKS